MRSIADRWRTPDAGRAYLLRFYGAQGGQRPQPAARAAVTQIGLWARARSAIPLHQRRNLAQMVSIAAVLVIILLFVKVRAAA